MDDLISIIVPVYNVEKYLKKCVESIINQTYKNIEIILVDDGSSDKSGDICDEIAKTDDRIKVFHKKNSGLSDTRNFGIDKAKGKYIGFIDSDDYIKNNMYEVLYKAIKKYNADLSMCRVVDCYCDNVIDDKENDNDIKKTVLNTHDAIKMIMIGEEAGVHAVSKLYRRTIFDSKIRFEKGRTIEDAIIMIDLVKECEKIVYCQYGGYYYFHRANSITTTKFNERKYDIIYAYKKNYQTIEKEYPDLISLAHMRLCWANFNVLDNIAISNVSADKEIIKYLKSNFMFIIRCPYFTKARKISMCALKVSYKLYVFIAKKFYAKKRKSYA